MIEPGVGSGHAIAGLAVASEGNQSHAGVSRIRANATRNFQPVQLRKSDIEDDDIRADFIDQP
jgi:hypothetical protein